MYLIVASVEDSASMNIRRALMEEGDWEEAGALDDAPVYHLSEKALLITIRETHLYSDDIDRRAADELGIRMPDTVIFLSRHSSESGIRSLTVHTPGCYTTADFGGRPGTLVPSAPGPMTRAMRGMKTRAGERGLDFKVSFEVTHHGPHLETPAFFIEIGSSEREWSMPGPAEVLASTLLEVMDAGPETDEGVPVAIGVGGGHYAPRFTDVALDRKVFFGHMVPGYVLDDVTDDVLAEAAEKTPGASKVYYHRKAMKGPQYQRLKSVFGDLGLERIRQKHLDRLGEDRS